MRALFQDGFGKDLLILWLVAVLAVTGLALGGSRAADAYLSRAVEETLGSSGTYDAIVHLRSDAATGGLDQVEEILERAHPGIGLRRGAEVAGNASLFVTLPAEARNRAGFEGLPELVRNVPGFNGVTYLVEPSVEVANIAPGLERELAARVEREPGVAFAFRHGDTVTAVLTGPDRVRSVSERLRRLAADRRLVELRLPLAGTVDPREAVERLAARSGLALRPVDPPGAASPGLAAALRQLDTLLPLLSEQDGMKGAWQQAAQQLRDLAGAVGQGREAARSAAASGSETAAQLQAALHEVESLKARVDQLTQELASPSGRGAALDLLAQLLLENLAGESAQANPDASGKQPGADRAPGGARDPLAAVQGLKPEALAQLQGHLEALRTSLDGMDPAALEQAAVELEATAARLPSLTGAQVEELRSLVDTWTSRAAGTEGRIYFTAPGGADQGSLARVAREELGDAEATASLLPAATVRPNARASLLQLLHQARGLVAGILVVVLAAVHLLLDLSAVRSGAAALGRLRPGRGRASADGRPAEPWTRFGRWIRRRERLPDATWLFAAVWGAVVLAASYGLAGAELPYVTWQGAALAGALLALAAWALAGRINPVRAEEVELAVAAGLTPAQVMRAVVLPEARPSLLGFLARRGRLLEGPGGSAAPRLLRALGNRWRRGGAARGPRT
ncbi:hypothetical protein [Limnochorda pilosa]|uniref:Uncharacterized protein n=1 Tax=Limnochorda pilosa TaxID=1555112 RepID=A0A0K2SP67_LIMPI|nr:hypothetical protein [Limnochorda pilosa]BAS28896.1 hypothetical protein LIP_3067 [Limnochorda pilosa]